MDIKSLHKIRSTYISRLRDAGMSFEKIAEEVGHQQIQTTMNNYSFDVNTDEENLRMMNAGLNLRPSVRGRLNELKKAARPAVHTTKSAKYAEVCR